MSPAVIANRFLERQAYNIPGGHYQLNPSQNRAIRRALEKPFTVIQGPPGGAPRQGEQGCPRQVWATGSRGRLCSLLSLYTGTGKTVVGLHIIYWFHRSNQEQVLTSNGPHGEERLGGPCILYCGPSNKSVDVLAGVQG